VTPTARELLQTFAACLAVGDVVGAGDLWAPNAVYEEAPAYHFAGAETIQRFLADFVAHHRDARLTFRRMLASPDGVTVAAEWEWRHVRTADGETRRFTGMCFATARGGLLVEWKGYSTPS
jgi:ketosteroid isomerase-like protein